jgi:hypothetical protein
MILSKSQRPKKPKQITLTLLKVSVIIKKYVETFYNIFGCNYIYRCPRVAKKLRNLFVIKDINFFFFLDDSYAYTAYSENIAVYIQSVPIL